MSLEAKGTIKLEEMGVDAEGAIFSKFSVKAPTLAIEQDLPKDVATADLAVEVLKRMIKERVQQDFQRPIEITLVGLSISCSFDIDPINNRTLDEFTKNGETTVSIHVPGRPEIKTNPQQLALAGQIMEISNATGIPPEEVFAAAKAKARSKPGAD